jgi:tRNA threonylcarbamoyladenosine biosynthesis protein TsaB
MSLILSVETSTPVCSAALHLQGDLLAHFELHEAQSHAGKLALLVESVLKITGKLITDVDAVAVSSGPGSYTGLRIGTSTAKGICYAINVPLLSCNSLEVMATSVPKANFTGALFCPMLDARRMEVYCMLLNDVNETVMPVEAKIIDDTSFQDVLSSQQVVFFGDGADKCRGLIQHPNAIFLTGQYPRASGLGLLASKKLLAGLVEDLTAFEPFYLKEFLIKKSSKVLE